MKRGLLEEERGKEPRRLAETWGFCKSLERKGRKGTKIEKSNRKIWFRKVQEKGTTNREGGIIALSRRAASKRDCNEPPGDRIRGGSEEGSRTKDYVLEHPARI